METQKTPIKIKTTKQKFTYKYLSGPDGSQVSYT